MIAEARYAKTLSQHGEILISISKTVKPDVKLP